jgi:GT2 family glycosyltransferase
MGNSAWRLDALRGVGGFDTRLSWGGEDYDVNLRVAKAGHRGGYVPDAWVHHDQGGRNDLRRLLRRKYRYNVGATLAYMKNGVLREKMRSAARNTVAFRHPYERWNLVIQPLALLRALTLRRKVLR